MKKTKRLAKKDHNKAHIQQANLSPTENKSKRLTVNACQSSFGKANTSPLDIKGSGFSTPQHRTPTINDLKKIYGPAKTLGIPSDKEQELCLAMDEELNISGFYSLLQHAYSLGQPPQGNGFIGYATLSNLAENGFITSCIETVADDMVREWINFENKGNLEYQEDISNKIACLEASVEQFDLRRLFSDAITKTRYFGGGLLFIDTGVTDPQTLKLPLDKSEKSAELGKGKLKGFKFIEPMNVFPGQYNTSNPLSPHYFEPQSWWVLGKEVHASRFIKLTTGDTPILLRPSYNFFGIPTAQILWDYVLHFQKDRVAASRMLSKYSDTVFKIGGLRDSLTQPDGTTQLDRRIHVMARNRNNDSITAIDMENEDIVKVESNLSGLTDIPRQGLEFICAINRTPAVKLLGISPSGFNATGESDITNYNDHIGTMQEKILRHPLKQALECLQLHTFGHIKPAITFSFCKLNKDDDQALNAIKVANTTALSAIVDAQIITPDGARAAITKNPEAYLEGLLDGIEESEKGLEKIEDGEESEAMPANEAFSLVTN